MVDNIKYVQTQFGKLPIGEVPLIDKEMVCSKVGKLSFFFVVIIILLLIFIYMVEWYPHHTVKKDVYIKAPFKTIEDHVIITSLDVYNIDQEILVENIVLITTDNNVINVDTIQNNDLMVIRKQNGLLYTIDFKQELDIKEIIIISNERQFINHININLFNEKKLVWSYCGYLLDRRENTIPITKIFFPEPVAPVELEEYDENKVNHLVVNEEALALRLTEDSECYVSY